MKEVGGTEGVGVTFLEETFSAATAPPEHRYHQKAARAVLKALLPESGTDIKGHMRSYAELLEASGYGSRPKDFDDLLRILDSEIRLITPTDPEGKDEDSDSASQIAAGQKYYQLTHDYLVQSLRDWLTRKQKETRRGRAELLLADRAAVWNARPENRQLPSLLQWLQIRWLTAKKNWTPPQRKMMAKAGRYHAVRGLVVAVLLAVLGFAGLTIREQVGRAAESDHAAGLVQRLLDANTHEVPAIVADMSPYRRWIDPLLREELRQGERARIARKKLHASLALLPVDATQVDYLYGRLLDAEPHEVPVIRDALAPHKDELLDKLWAVVETPDKGKESQRLRAAAALAKYDPESEKWAKVQDSSWSTIWCWRTSVYLASVDGGAPSGAREAASSRCPTSFEIANRRDGGTLSGDGHSGRLCRRPAASVGRSADGRRREAVRRDLSEVQGTWRARAARADRRDRQEAAARLPSSDDERGEAGEAAGECGGGPAQDEPAGEGLAAA